MPLNFSHPRKGVHRVHCTACDEAIETRDRDAIEPFCAEHRHPPTEHKVSRLTIESMVETMRPAMGDDCSMDELRAYAHRLTAEDSPFIVIPRPRITTGPLDLTINQATVSYLRDAEERVRKNRYWGSGVTTLVADLLGTAAAALTPEDTP